VKKSSSTRNIDAGRNDDDCPPAVRQGQPSSAGVPLCLPLPVEISSEFLYQKSVMTIDSPSTKFHIV